MKKAKTTMSRAEAEQVYEDLRKTMAGLIAKEKEWRKQQGQGKATSSEAAKPSLQAARAGTSFRSSMPVSNNNRGPVAALAFVMLMVSIKFTIALMEFAGILSVPSAQASYQAGAKMTANPAIFQNTTPGNYSREEMKILTSLDARRVELEDRASRLDKRESEINQRDAEFAGRLTQIRDLTEKLKANREQGDRKRGEQLAQLSNVYGSMAPEESAALLEQLDITIALELIERMPEKRIAQILAHMRPDKALSLTRMLSGRANESKL